MALEAKVTRKLDNGFVQVEVGSKNIPTRYFKVPVNNADSFCTSYKKQQKSADLWTNMAFGSSILAGVACLSLLTSKLNKALAITIGIIGGIAAGAGSTIGCANHFANKQSKLVKSFGAEEIDYNNKKLPI